MYALNTFLQIKKKKRENLMFELFMSSDTLLRVSRQTSKKSQSEIDF